MMQITNVVKQLLIINIILFVGTYIVPELTAYFAMFFFENPNFRIWQPLTHMFMHGSLMHIFFNMFALYSFGSLLENIWGSKKFLFFYIACGFGAAALHMAVNYYQVSSAVDILVSNGISSDSIYQVLNKGQFLYNPEWRNYLSESQIAGLVGSYGSYAVGASGAIYGLLIAFAYMFPNAELALMFIPIPIKAKFFVPVILLYDLYSGFNGGAIFGTSTGIAHFAHLGGALMGFILVLIWKKNQFNNIRWDNK